MTRIEAVGWFLQFDGNLQSEKYENQIFKITPTNSVDDISFALLCRFWTWRNFR